MLKALIIYFTHILVLARLCWCGELEKIVWNVVKLAGKDRAGVNLKVALETIQDGKMVGLPTDTVYGFVVDATKSRPISRLYNTTGPKYADQPVAISVDSINEVSLYADIDMLDRGMISQLLPGKVTVVLRRRKGALPNLNPDHEIIPVRIPGQKERLFIRKITHALGKPLAIVSARIVGRPHSRIVDDFEDIRLKAYVVFDGGKMEKQRMEGTTIVDLSYPGKYKILRPGCVLAAVESILQRYELEDWPEGPNITIFNPT